MDLFKKNPDTKEEVFEFRQDIGELVRLFNIISHNPFEYVGDPEFMEYLPFRWSVNQLYLLIESVYEQGEMPNFLIVQGNEKYEIEDSFVIKISKVIDESDDMMPSFIQFTQKLFDDTLENQDFFEELQTAIQSQKDLSPIVEKLQKRLKLHSLFPILLPSRLRFFFNRIQLPTLNSDLLGFLYAATEWRDFIDHMQGNEMTKYLFHFLNQNPLIYKALRKFFLSQENVDTEQWGKIWMAMLEDIMMNIVIVSNRKLFLAFRFIAKNESLTVNPIPIEKLKIFGGKNFTNQEIALKIYNQTGLRTLVIDKEELAEYLNTYMNEQSDLLDLIARVASLFYSSSWYPDSLLNSFLKLFGLEIGTGFKILPKAIKQVIQYYKTTLLVTFLDNTEDEEEHEFTIVELVAKDGKTSMNLVESDQIVREMKQLGQIPRIQQLQFVKSEVEKLKNTSFTAVFGFDLNILSDSLSAKNMEAMLGISNMTTQLPLVASLGGLFMSMKALNVDDATNTQDNPMLDFSPQEDVDAPDEKMKFYSYFEEFLKKGILCIFDESRNSVDNFRLPIYSQEGYLGLDLEAIKKYLQNQLK